MTAAPPRTGTGGPDGNDWQRLDRRMLLIHPIRELLRFLPVLLGLFVAGTASGGVDARWQLLGVAVPVALGLLRYLTTAFRIAEERIELRRGLLNKHVLSTRLDRVRTVDVTAPPIHRLLGLATLRVGTGTASTNEEDHLDLDGLPAERARALRAVLLDTTPAAGDGVPPQATPATDRVVLRLDPAWARFAPLTSSGVALAAVLVGLGSQVLDGLGVVEDVDPEAVLTGVAGLALLPVLLAVAVAIAVLAVAAYLIANWDFTITHRDRAWHLHRGLFTTRETSLDEERVAGVAIGEPIGLRLARGGRLSAIVTGLDRKTTGSSVLVPPAPRAVVAGVAAEVLGTSEPVTAPLRAHGPRARTRRFTRALVPAGVL
ncbi:MAG: PH domain-containing protein, partial [Nocardioides sp.]